jgi:hypothetical protein
MALTKQQEDYYKNCVHELNRGIFFGNVPNYVNLMDKEILRLEAESPDYEKIKKKDLDDWSKVKPYGEKIGSDKKEKTVTSRTGIIFSSKDKVKVDKA